LTKLIPAFIALVSLGLAVPDDAAAYSLKTVFSVGGSGDGARPQSDLVVSDGIGYGTTSGGGAYGQGSIYSVVLATGAVKVLYSFKGGAGGSYPTGGLNLIGGVLYGTTSDFTTGTPTTFGTVFSYNPSTVGFKTIHRFQVASGGIHPSGDMVELGGKLYGVTSDADYRTCPSGGTCTYTEIPGSVFAIDPVSTAFSTVHVFGANTSNNGDGVSPVGGLSVSGTTLYGATSSGGANGSQGTIFQIDTKTGTESVIYSFPFSGKLFYPNGRLAIVGNVLYGTADSGGANGCGAIFSINLAKPTPNLVHSFSTSKDGCGPQTGLTVLANSTGTTLYGTTGTNIFSISTGGANETVYPLPSGSGEPSALTITGNGVYGTTTRGGPAASTTNFGSGGSGTIFALSLSPGQPVATLYTFTGPTSPQNPGISQSLSSALVGVTNEGGVNGLGTIFQTTFGSFGENADAVKTLHTFSGGSDGAFPNSPLVSVGSTLYGTTAASGVASGTVFSIGQQGGKKTVLHTFEGQSPNNLVGVGKTLFGTTYSGGFNGSGTIFSMSLTGGSLTTLHKFVAATKANGYTGDGPPGGLVEVSGNLYGLTGGGVDPDTSALSCGSVYRLTPGSTGVGAYKTLYTFANANTYECGAAGGNPVGTLVSTGGYLYGALASGGTNGSGAIFLINPFDSAEKTVVSLPSDIQAKGGLTLVSGNFFGPFTYGASNYGGVYEYEPPSATASIIYNFTGGADGGNPLSPLFVTGGYLYGMTSEGGAHGAGTVFAIVP
jgi:uncharacterized repeat protein (TIGR03803 family)